MVDILRRYLAEITKLTSSYSTLFGHTQPNLDELGLAFRDLHINIADLEEYVHYVDSSPPVEIPQYPVRKESHLNFLKPGSNEVVTRPVHIHEHLPPMLPEIEEGEQNSAVPKLEEAQQPNQDTSVFKRPADMPPNDANAKRPRLVLEEEGRPTREISSVMMTTSGFLSPAREGKLPEARTPINTMDSPLLHGNSNTNIEPRTERKGPKMLKESKKIEKRKDKASKELFKPLPDDIIAKKFTTMKDVVKMKAIKANAANIANNNAIPPPEPISKPVNHVKSSPVAKTPKIPLKSTKNEKPSAPSPLPPPPPPKVVPQQPDKIIEGKLSSESNKSKLNIFKKISKAKEDKIEKTEKGKMKSEQMPPESRESSPDLIIDESDMKNWDQSKFSNNKPLDMSIKHQDTSEKLPKTTPLIDTPPKVFNVIKSPIPSDKDFLYDDDISPPGTPSTPKTPEMPSHSPPLKVEKDLKRKRKEKNKVKNKNKIPKHSLSPRQNKCDPFETDLDRPKTPDDPLSRMKEDPLPIPPQPAVPPYSFFPNFIPGPGLIPAPLGANPLFNRLPMAAGLPKHGFGQPAHIPPAMPTLPFTPPVKPVEEPAEKPPPPVTPNPRDHEVSVPKLTLKIGSPRPRTPDVIARKIMIKPVVKKEEEAASSALTNNSTETQDTREPSPELARISALITRPPKPKASKDSHGSKDDTGTSQTNTSPKQSGPVPGRSRINANANKGPSVAASAAPAGTKPVPGKQKSMLQKRQQSSVVDKYGEKVWICPACRGQDDGSPMIGCDDCDAWYHWVCVGIQVPPDDNEDWYCRICIVKKQETLQIDKKKKRKKKDRKEH
ncbi:TBP-associated factor 3 [Carabus blaptoides fortunei]